MANFTTNESEISIPVNNPYLPISLKVCAGIVLVTSAIFGIIGNMFTCAVVYRKAPMRSAINLLLTNIAFADLVLSVMITPVTFYKLVRPDVYIHVNVCIILSVVKDTFIAVMSYTLLTISVDRFLIIVYKKDRLCVHMAKQCTGVIWCVALVFTSLQFLSTIRNTMIFDNTFCDHDYPYSVSVTASYTTILTTVTFYIPALVMFYLYASILRTVQLSSKRVHNHCGTTISVSVTQYSNKLGLPPVATPYRFTGDFNAKRRAFGTILILYIALLACWMPYIVRRTADDLIGASKSRDIAIHFVFIAIGLSKCAVYPLILCFRNKKFRTACMRVLPSSVRFSTKCLRIKSRRISPKTVYECSEDDSRV